MNSYVTIGFKKDKEAEIICQPNIPYKEQKSKFHKINTGFIYVEIWSKSSGMIKRKRIKESSKTQTVQTVQTVSQDEKLELEETAKELNLTIESKENVKK